jgi:hypothetical protein
VTYMTQGTTPSCSDIGGIVTTSADMATLQLIDASVTEIKGVRVFDVGQGDCIGLRDQDDNVCCYIDYGGNEYHPDNNKSGNTALRLPVLRGSQYVSVILTHWDKDHYWSANKKNPAAQQCDWLTPRQWVSPQAARFAAKLARIDRRSSGVVRRGDGLRDRHSQMRRISSECAEGGSKPLRVGRYRYAQVIGNTYAVAG